ncbi:cell cycle checkpoint control protein RAD9A [Phlebotomus argentipes]|uniref:cell cycle checkpoint control protein RAD9A n=1 Tax=Phlebotomus argentipes TaxID=94469 RepID=UPI0028933F92|nr:cell cycle checkpoint control protein RAD9A [Phlebotomus argentipes]
MKCSMNGTNTRILHKILQNLAKVGSDLYLEALLSGLSLRTVNSSHSSFAKIHLAESFFLEYIQQITPSNASFETKCRVSFKSLLSVFRHIKKVEVCTLRLDQETARLTLRLRCAEEKVRNMYVPILEQETLDATFHRDDIMNKIVCHANLFSNIMTQSETELTLDVSKEGIVVKNYIDDRIVDKTVARTTVTVNRSEFATYSIKQETRLTFCFKSLRAFLTLAEAVSAGCNVAIEFETEGRPIIITVNEVPVRGSLLMSTLEQETYDDSMMSTYDDAIHSEVMPNDQSIRSQNKRPKTSPIEQSLCPEKRPRAEKQLERPPIQAEGQLSDTLEDSRQDFLTSSTPDDILHRNPPQVVMNEDGRAESPSILTQNKDPSTGSSSYDIVFQKDTDETDNAKRKLSLSKENLSMEMEEDLDESVPPSPPTEEDIKKLKARRIFRRCFEATFHCSKIPGKSQILAENSDSE